MHPREIENPCETCDGTGAVTVSEAPEYLDPHPLETCERCGGSGIDPSIYGGTP